MDDKKNKKTLTISKTLTKKIDTTSFSKDGKKSFSIEKKKPFKSIREGKTGTSKKNLSSKLVGKKKTLARK